MIKTKTDTTSVTLFTERERLKMFEVEELEGRLESAWNDICPVTDTGCIIDNAACDVHKVK